MRALLRDFPEGVPQDTLLARIRGRRSYLVREWDRILLAPEPAKLLPPAPWRPVPVPGDGRMTLALQGEYGWVFRWMSEPLRVMTAPFFWLAELRVIAICLRRLAGGASGDDELLQGSLMNKRIRKLLRGAPDAESAVRQLAGILAPHAPACATLTGTLAGGGVGAVEAALQDIFLQQLAATRLHPVMERFLALTIDCRNLTAVAKRLRWRSIRSPRLIGGGRIPLKKLAALAKGEDAVAIARMAARLGGIGRSGDPDNLERTVLQAEYRAVSSLAREPDGVGEILWYLWRCRNEARIIGLLSRLATVGTAAVEAEIMQ